MYADRSIDILYHRCSIICCDARNSAAILECGWGAGDQHKVTIDKYGQVASTEENKDAGLVFSVFLLK